jgi:hypothetical protein
VWRALGRKVLAVAVWDGHTWKAYIDAVAGQNHDNEAPEVVRQGTGLEADVAKAIFPRFAGLPYQR